MDIAKALIHIGSHFLNEVSWLPQDQNDFHVYITTVQSTG